MSLIHEGQQQQQKIMFRIPWDMVQIYVFIWQDIALLC